MDSLSKTTQILNTVFGEVPTHEEHREKRWDDFGYTDRLNRCEYCERLSGLRDFRDVITRVANMFYEDRITKEKLIEELSILKVENLKTIQLVEKFEELKCQLKSKKNLTKLIINSMGAL